MSRSFFRKVTEQSPRPGTRVGGKVVRWMEHASKDYQVWYLRTPSPDPGAEREARWLESIARKPIQHLTRELQEDPLYVPVSPSDPHATWAISSGVVIGLQPDAVPDFVDLNSPRVGRAFEWQPPDSAHYIQLMIFPEHPANPLCPPYPGCPPRDFDSPQNSATCFSDGGLGKWDPHYYPQLFDPARPWLPYHRAPRPVSWWYEHSVLQTIRGEVVSGAHDRPLVPFYLPVTEFFVWNRPGHPDKGGYWRQDLLASLFVARTTAERTLLSNLDQLHEYEQGFDLKPFKLPWYNHLEYDQARQWTTWQEGRDAIGRTCLYTAEIEAFANWLWALHSMWRNPPYREPSQKPLIDEFMGAWAVTITSKEEWMALHRGLVPLYIISQVPSSHPIVPTLRSGDLDAGERYRKNHFNSAHEMPNTILSLPKFSFVKALHHNAVPERDDIPSKLFSPRLIPKDPTEIQCPKRQDPLSVVWFDPSHTTSSHQPWTSYIFTDPDVEMASPVKTLKGDPNRWVLAFKIDALQLFFIPPFSGVLTVKHYPHPLFWTIDGISESANTHYVEHRDTTINYWWFRIIDWNERRYFLKPINDVSRQATLEGTLEPEFVWLPPEDVSSNDPPEDPLPEDATFDYVEPVVPFSIEQIASLDEALEQDAEIFKPISRDEFKVAVTTQRAELQMQLQRRLFRPIKGDRLRAKVISPWKVSDSLDVFVWPLRVACLHADARPAKFLSVLSERFSIGLGDVLLVSSYQEVDLSQTIDLGLRYAEDALWIWFLLHGIRVDDHLLEVYPLIAMKGSGMILHSPPTSRGHDRRARLHDLLSFREVWPTNGDLSAQEAAIRLYLRSDDHASSSAGSINTPFLISLPSLLEGEGDAATAIQLSAADLHLDGLDRQPVNCDLGFCVKGNPDLHVLGFHAPSQKELSQSKRRKLEPDDLEEGELRPRTVHHGRRHKRSVDEVSDPTAGKSTNYRERHDLASMIAFRARQLHTASIVAIPPLPKFKSKHTLTFMKIWWDWLDLCHDILDQKQDDPQEGDRDWAILGPVFHHLARIRGVYGQERIECNAALQKRSAWVSKRRVNAERLYQVTSTTQHGPTVVHLEDLDEDVTGDPLPGDDVQAPMDLS
ncbi:hypothetical protein CPB86DRAFT_820202 [Serendipita vermifera]|nr:hypothetical protein CPB86DRAFT_820202 [Serendipita vermifera]